MSCILFDISGCFDVPGFELSRFYSIAATSKKKEQRKTCFGINNTFASSANMSKLLLIYSYDFWQTVPYYFRC